ncbi:MAG: alpha-glucan family phosphorylase [Bacteroidales bacterium]|nr:alpha-glucan family phosphorylase [Bacteroidales bacterium]
MTKDELMRPDYLFEVSWEVCNKVGGIYTVVATKALNLKEDLKHHHILVGPDVWMNVESNPDFIEDQTLFKAWKAQASSEGLRIRTGRWNIPGRPYAVLVDFKSFLSRQDDILATYWEKWGVDSLSGNWDYKESALFGYAAGRVIESFCRFNLRASDKAVAHFHEWQTGAGLLYLKGTGLPIATVFTTHATMMGRCIAGNNIPLYDSLKDFNGDEMARRLGVVSRNSLEKLSALNADVLTTVSDITAQECAQFYGRPVDKVTPNGFEYSFTPQSEEEYAAKRAQARKRLSEVASAMSGAPVASDALFVGIGGRYEYHNKGIDVFIDALAKLRNEGYNGREVHAFVLIPSGHNGPDKSLQAKLDGAHAPGYVTSVSHNLMNAQWDTVTRRFSEVGLHNRHEDKVKAYFIPCYLNGSDGIFNLSYYDVLVGLDTTMFPSYYEPWGYTPLESLAFKVPTLTTSLAGFGMWVRDHYGKAHPGIKVVDRSDRNYFEVVDAVAARISEIASLTPEQEKEYMESAADVAKIALWENQLEYYKEAYALALARVITRVGDIPANKQNRTMEYNKIAIDAPSWKSVMVTRRLPKKIAGLETLCKNLWWCWNESAKALFTSIDYDMWHTSGHNPMYLLDKVTLKRYKELANDEDFVSRLDAVMEEFNTYMAAKKDRKDPSIAYFCMEYGLDTSLKIYSGGLGILAGDYLKETSDMNVNLCAVGFLYRYGYFNQKLTAQGNQVAEYIPQDFMKVPAEPVYDENGNWVTTSVAFPGRTLTARIWKVAVGRTDLYLLDTDYEANSPEDRSVTHQLYGGNWENRLKQELLLGIGGIRALRALGIDTQVYHCNEGHAAFIGLERLREYIQNDNLDFNQALEVVRASSLFTTHTPVPAGHDAFDEGMLRQYIGHVPAELKISWEALMGLGKHNGYDVNEKFSMSILAANISQNVNGVSMLHGKVSQDIFASMYPGYLAEENHVGYVTNGVHYPTWCAKEWKAVHSKVFGPEFATHHYDLKCFEGIYNISDEEVWDVRKVLKKDLVRAIRDRLSDPALSAHYSPRQIVTIKKTLRDDVLTIGFARRFATYKRATLLFSDLDRLDAIVNNPQHPVQFIFAGKAHPADGAGQDLIRQIVEISKQPRFIGKIVFVPGYDITLAKRLVQGVDVWLNNPTRPQEASGTSGEKAAMNGVMHFSVLDGWWVEGYKEGAGWALPMERTYDDQGYQNELDSATIYSIIENDIAPAYYNVDRTTGRSAEWIGYIKNTIAQVACNFTTNRMLTDYCNQYYYPQAERTEAMKAGDFALARELAAWKENVRHNWKNVEVVSYTQPDSSYVLSSDNNLCAEVVLNVADLNPEDLGVEMLFCVNDKKGQLHIEEKSEFQLVKVEENIATFRVELLPERTGMYQVATRIYPKNDKLPHRQDFALVKWL